MSTQNETMPMEPEVQVKTSRGCFFYGCLTAIAVSVGSILCCGIGSYFFVSSQVQKYTAETPVALPSVEFTEEEVTALETRLNTFTESLDAGDTPPDLVLTADEINALIGKEKELRGKVFVKIEDGEIKGDVSIPADAVWGGEGRFFNASASFNVTMDEGVLIVTMASAEVNGEAIPEQFMQGISKENLAKDLYKDAKNAKKLRRIESVEIVDDKLVLKLRRDAAGRGPVERPIDESKQGDAVAPTETNSEPEDAAKEGADVEVGQ